MAFRTSVTDARDLDITPKTVNSLSTCLIQGANIHYERTLGEALQGNNKTNNNIRKEPLKNCRAGLSQVLRRRRRQNSQFENDKHNYIRRKPCKSHKNVTSKEVI